MAIKSENYQLHLIEELLVEIKHLLPRVTPVNSEPLLLNQERAVVLLDTLRLGYAARIVSKAILFAVLSSVAIHAQALPAKPQPQKIIHNGPPSKWSLVAEVGVITAATLADGLSTCHAVARGGVEQNVLLGPHPSCGAAIGFSFGAAAYWTGFQLLTRKFITGEDKLGWRLAGHLIIPTAAAIIHGRDAYVNYRQ